MRKIVNKEDKYYKNNPTLLYYHDLSSKQE